jgi:SAM-dependent methyltransferase
VSLFDLEYSPEWGYDRRFFLDVEHRYTKMHALLREGYGDLSGARILDLGLSRGLFLERFRRYPDVQLGGIEIADDEIKEARKRGLEPVRHFINQFDGNRMVARLPWGDSQADVILAGEIIEHVVDTEGFLREIHRVLRPSGAVVLSTPNILWWKHRVALLAGRYPDALDYRLRYGADFGHVRIFTPDHLRTLLEETGFVDVKLAGKRLGSISTLDGPDVVGRALDALARLAPRLSDHVIAVARTG